MLKGTQNEVNNENTLEEVIKKKLNLNNSEELENYDSATKLMANFLLLLDSNIGILLKDRVIISILKKCALSYPFLIQSSLIDDILNRTIEDQILEEVNSRLESLNSTKERMKTKNDIDYIDSRIEKLNARKAEIEAGNNYGPIVINPNGSRLFIHDVKTRIEISNLKSIEERFTEELKSYIEQLDGNNVQSIYSKFMDKNLQKKMVRANRAARIGDCILCVFFCGMIVGPVVSCVLYSITNKEMLLISSIPIPLLAILSLCIVSLYELSTKNTVRNELEEMKESLNLNCENNQLKLDVEGNTRTK